MSQIFSYIRTYYEEEFNPRAVLLTGLMLTILIAVNYTVNIERSLRPERDPFNAQRILFYFFYFGLPWLAALLFMSFFRPPEGRAFLRDWGFWLLAGLAFLIFAVSAAVRLDAYNAIVLFGPALALFGMRVGNNLLEFLLLIIPAAIYWYFRDREHMPLYGLHKSGFDVRPYFVMLLCAAPFIFLASFGADFLRTYPRYMNPVAAQYLGVDPLWTYLIFEFFYGLAFVGVEFFFRGFMILAFVRYLGPGAILPAAAFYCVIHFQKPMLETVSSIFGGMLLGIIACYGRSIYGGIIAHVGIAWMMEAAAFIQFKVFGAVSNRLF